MLRLKKIAVTGGIASGKTTVCRFFEKLGAYVVSADQIVHRLLSPETDLGQDIIQLLGPEIVREGKLDRRAIAKIVFSDVSLLEKLEKRIHPEVQKEIEAAYQKVSRLHYPLFVAEVPLLFESGQDIFYDATCTVIAKKEICEERLVLSGGVADEFKQRDSRLLSMEEKAKLATFVIENNGNLDELCRSVQTIFNSLKGSL